MMDMITNVVMQNANVSHKQAREAIEAVLAYIANEMPETGKAVSDYVLSSNGTSVGGFMVDQILDSYKANFGEVPKN
ncbi:hypothetical protein ACLI1A_05105 [Flavobacterium sp. RHBU_3]|uniref:hypothetical protein n=1 Tax=Flavobacterium sp. RHBU_3 TaxID=3391184 RepID=UPI00398554FD